jgi:hypothetical protein
MLEKLERLLVTKIVFISLISLHTYDMFYNRNERL